MLFDKETIYGIVTDGRYSRRKAAILQGEKLTKEQREWWDEAEIALTASKDEKKERKKRIDKAAYGTDEPMTGAERVRKHMALKAAIDAQLDEAIKHINWRRRRRAEKSLLAFVKIYGTDEGSFLEDLPPEEMESILDEMQMAADDSSVPFHIRVARGHGKTSYAKLCGAWASSTGRRKYIVAVGSNAENAKSIIDDILSFFTDCPKFAQDFPEVSIPLAALNGVYQRARSQTYHGKPTRIKLGMGIVILPTIEGAKSSGVILRSVGFDTNARGMVKKKQRPDFLILDDLQKDDLAGNEDRVIAAAAHIRKTFLGLAGHKKKIAALMTSTPIEPDDLSETFAKDPAWKTTTYPMVKSWPTAWNTGNYKTDLWGQYRDILNGEIAAGNKSPHLPANRFYRANRAAMDAGAKVLNPKNYDKAVELSGIQHAMNILIRDGEDVFNCEYQMKPRRNTFTFEVSAQMIMNRIRPGVKSCTIPEDTVLTVAATDINPAYGLTTAIISFDVSLTGLVTAYKVYRVSIDGRLNDVAFNKQVNAALHAHAKEIAALNIKIDRWGIDAGGRQFKAVTKFAPFASGMYGIEAIAMLGRAGQNWNPFVRSRIREALNDTVYCRDNHGAKWLAFNADIYKERAQRAWGTEIGGAGGLSLYDGANHAKFAIQIANEKLVEKARIKNPRGNGEDQYAYKWKTKNPHDYGDCMAMCFAIAAAKNLTGDGDKPLTSGKRKRKVYNG